MDLKEAVLALLKWKLSGHDFSEPIRNNDPRTPFTSLSANELREALSLCQQHNLPGSTVGPNVQSHLLGLLLQKTNQKPANV